MSRENTTRSLDSIDLSALRVSPATLSCFFLFLFSFLLLFFFVKWNVWVNTEGCGGCCLNLNISFELQLHLNAQSRLLFADILAWDVVARDYFVWNRVASRQPCAAVTLRVLSKFTGCGVYTPEFPLAHGGSQVDLLQPCDNWGPTKITVRHGKATKRVLSFVGRRMCWHSCST